MSETARIQNIEVLRDVKNALLEFARDAALTITSVDSDVQRVGQWLTLERPAHWKHEVRRREEGVEAAKAEIRRKELAAHPNPADTVLERKALKRAKDKLERAMQKRDRVRKWAPAWEREATIFKGGCAPLNEVLHREIPAAIARLDKMLAALEDYFKMAAPPTEGPATATAESTDSMARNIQQERALAHPGDRYGPLRNHTPTDALRLARPEFEMELPRLDWQAGTPDQKDAEAISRLALNGPPPTPDQLITLAWRATKDDAVFLVRLPPAGGETPKDSGWYIGPLEYPETSGGLRTCTLSELLNQIPALAPILNLTEGALIVLHRGIIKAILDPNNNDAWSTGLVL